MEAWQIITHYESKLVTRNWLFRFFVVGVLAYALIFLVPWDMHREMWWKVVGASSILARGVYFLNLLQSLVVIFLVCDIQRRRNSADSREILFVRPLSNVRMFWAELVGMTFPFLVVDAIFIALCLLIDLVIPDLPANPRVCLSFLVRDVLPTFVFVMGASLLVNRVLRHPFLSWLVLVVFLIVSYIFLEKPLHGILDFRGSLLPGSFSSIVGFMHSEMCLLQRGVFLFLGLGLLCVALPFTRRLANVPEWNKFYSVASSLFLSLAVGIGYLYVDKFQNRRENREAYRAVFARYEAYPKGRIVAHDITYTPVGEKFMAESRMTVMNRRAEKLEQLILFLNPGVEISSLKTKDGKVAFRRDRQVVVIDQTLAPGDSVMLTMEYGGRIDEDIYQVNMDDERYFAPERQLMPEDRYGKRSAFLSRTYTLLIPEVLWYPMAVAPLALLPSKETDFTNYTLCVKNPDGQMVVSQGIPEKRQGEMIFRNLQALTGLSLCMGDYVKRSVVVDSVTVEFYTYPGNDFYLKPFDGWIDEIKGYPDPEKYREELINQCRDCFEKGSPNPYPFKILKIVEAPSSFLNTYASFHNDIQPEMVFFKERMLENYYKPGNFSPDELRGINVQENMLLHEFPRFFMRMGVERLFTDFHWSVASDRYAGIDMLFGKMVNPSLDKFVFLFPSMLDCVASGGLEGLIQEGNANNHPKVVYMKVSQLLAYLTTITSWDSVYAHIQEFYENARFREVDFDRFMEGFHERFGQDIKPFVDEWFTTREVPRLVIKDLRLRRTKDIQLFDFKVGNIGKIDGVVSIISANEDDFGKKNICKWQSYLIKPGEYKRIVVGERDRLYFFLSMNFTRKIPERFEFEYNIPLWEGDLPEDGVISLDRDQFYPPGEIIVDNEDEGFLLIDSAGNKFKKLADRLAKGDEEEYQFGGGFKKSTWGKPFLQQNGGVYGEEIPSAFIKVAGNGSCKAVWTANLPEAGKYEIFVYRSEIGHGDGNYDYRSNYPGMKNYYTVCTPEGNEEIEWEVVEEDVDDWISLGTFTLLAGESSVVLDDRGIPPVEPKKTGKSEVFISGSGKVTQLVVADAVKWVRVK